MQLVQLLQLVFFDTTDATSEQIKLIKLIKLIHPIYSGESLDHIVAEAKLAEVVQPEKAQWKVPEIID